MTAKPEITIRRTRRLPETGSADNATAKPGGLRGGASLLVQTRQAQRLIHGRAESDSKAAIVGLVRFGMLMRRIWTAATVDDPYADWFLVRILDALEKSREEIEAMHKEIRKLLHAMQGIEIDIATSTAPVRVPLNFANPYGYMGAYLVADYDDFVRTVLTVKHVGLVSRNAGEQMVHRGSRLVRRAFAVPLGWKHFAIARNDIRQNNQRAQQALDKMGELPQEILEGTLRSRIAPEIHKVSTPT